MKTIYDMTNEAVLMICKLRDEAERSAAEAKRLDTENLGLRADVERVRRIADEFSEVHSKEVEGLRAGRDRLRDQVKCAARIEDELRKQLAERVSAFQPTEPPTPFHETLSVGQELEVCGMRALAVSRQKSVSSAVWDSASIAVGTGPPGWLFAAVQCSSSLFFSLSNEQIDKLHASGLIKPERKPT